MDSLWSHPKKAARDLRDFLRILEENGELKQIDAEIDPALEITEVSRRVLAKGGPALLFNRSNTCNTRVLSNLFGTQKRIAWALGAQDPSAFSELGELLAALKAPQPPRGVAEIWRKLPLLKDLVKMAPKTVGHAVCQEHRLEGEAVDSITGEQLAAAMRWGGGGRFGRAGYTKTGDAKIILTRWAKKWREKLDKLNGITD